ncbi:3-phosphoshikimate 1-carboxyvinyltransferase [Pseudoalteromonas sp. NBT06-2]|nr:3-phosphoshikimate 1-carboxyvinyltransferase [Pseudoalteromonas sp. NBT06-2]
MREKLKCNRDIKKLLEKMPIEVQDSFTEEQLANLKIAVSARSWGKHAIDFRSTIKFFRYRYYYVFVAGRNLRELTRGEKQLSLLAQALFCTVFLTFCTALGVLILYLVKSALGINIFTDFSFGVWDWFKSTLN